MNESTGMVSFALIGCGRQGRRQMEKLLAHPRVKLRCVVDPDPSALEHAPKGVERCRSVDSMFGKGIVPDAAVVAVPTPVHLEAVAPCLEAGMAVMLEKPLAADVESGREILQLSRGRILRVGHNERFNPSVLAVERAGEIHEPLFAEVHRIGPFSARVQQVDVVLDLMIHDLDLLLLWTRDKVSEVRAAGAAILTDELDIANARLEFSSGFVANITASRASMGRMRKLRVFCRDRYISLDLDHGTVEQVIRRNGSIEAIAPSEHESTGLGFADSLAAQLDDFVCQVLGRNATGRCATPQEAFDALEIACIVKEAVMEHAAKVGIDWT